MDFRILGPLGVYDDQGRELEPGGRQQRIVLAMLLLHRNEVVSVDRLIDAVWGERAPANAVKNVQIHVSRLRKTLAADVLRTRANGYVLEVGPDELDVDRFERLVEEGRRALAAGSLEDAAVTLEAALALWRGAPLSDFAYDSFAQSEISRLDELRLGAVEERLDTDLALGRHQDVTGELQALTAQHPLRERLRGQLMLALYRSGRKPDALRVYDEARRLLAEELGLEPGEALQRLHQAVLTDDPALEAPPRVAPTRAPAGARAAPPPVSGRRTTILGVGGALLLAAAVAVAVLTVTRDQTSAGLVSVLPNSLAAIDPETNRVVAEIPVGIRPASVLSAHGSLWVANLDDDTVQRIDPKTKRVVKTIAIGTAPSGLAATRDAVWAIGEDGVILRIDPEFNEVVRRIETVKVGTQLGGALAAGAVAATNSAVWAVSGGFFSLPRLFRVDPATNRPQTSAATGNSPTAVAVGFGDVWIADNFENTVTRVDPAGVVVASIPVGHGASALAVGEDAVWVALSLDDAVARIDPTTNSVVETIPVGRFPSSIAVAGGDVWVGNRHDGTVSRIDPTKNEVVDTIEVASSPAGLAVAGGSLWLTSQTGAGSAAEAATARGVVRFSAAQDFETDPARYPDPQISYATCAKLLNYPDEPAPAGTHLVPEVAASLPRRSADGTTYTFTIRSGFEFSGPRRERVTAETFKYAIERSLNPRMGVAGSFVHDLVGQAAYQEGKASHISGVVADGDTLTVKLVEPAADFPARIAMSFFCAVPLNTPIDPNGVREIPSAGPYYIAEHVPNRRIVLKRNPNYHGSRPRRLREIHYSLGRSPAKNVADVEAGRSDYLADGFIPPDVEAEAKLAGRYGPASAAARNGRQRYFVNPRLGLAYFALNTSRPLFSDVRLRKAVNFAIDRRALARHGNLGTGPFPAIPTDQYLPPAMPGASPTTLYPPSGDVQLARRLAPNARGTAVLYTCNLEFCRHHAHVIRSNLRALGLDVDVREFPIDVMFAKAGTKGEPYDIVTGQWFADWADPSTFLNVLLHQRITPHGNLNLARFVDARYARKLERVARLAGPGRYRAYEALSVELARDAAPWVVFGTGTSRDFFSARLGCQVFHPFYGMDIGRLCIRK